MADEIIHGGDMVPVTYQDGRYERPLAYDGECGVFLSDGRIPAYNGETQVIPKARSDTILETKDRIVREDITVTKVPFYQAENPSGGQTVYIAKE